MIRQLPSVLITTETAPRDLIQWPETIPVDPARHFDVVSPSAVDEILAAMEQDLPSTPNHVRHETYTVTVRICGLSVTTTRHRIAASTSAPKHLFQTPTKETTE